MKISVVGVFYNCKDTLEKAIESVFPIADEFIAIDQGSTDGTSEILMKHATYYEYTSNKGYCEYHRGYAIEKATGDWILWLDGDEMWSLNLFRFLLHFKNQIEYDELRVRRLTYSENKLIQNEDGLAPRFWRKEGITYSPVIHSQPIGLKKHLTRNDLMIEHFQGNKEQILKKLEKYDEVCDTLLNQNLIDVGTKINLCGLANAARERTKRR